METAIVWTASACQGNPGAGGYATAISVGSEEPVHFHNGRRMTTSERMEFFAAIRALTALQEPHNIELRSTNETLVNTLNLQSPEAHPDLSEHLLPLLQRHNTIAILQKKRTDPEHQVTYAFALRASQSHPDKPDTGYENAPQPEASDPDGAAPPPDAEPS